MTKITAIPLNNAPTKQDALDVVESLKQAIESGQLVAFAAVGIEENDNTSIWCFSTRPVSRLRMLGAMHHMLHSYENEC